MKNKIYIVQEKIGVMGEIRQQMIRAFACKRTAKKFIDYKNLKLEALRKQFEGSEPELLEINSSKKETGRFKRFLELQYSGEYFLQELDLHA